MRALVLQFYAEVEEMDAWLRERRPLVTSADLGRDEDSVQALLRKTDILSLDIDNFSSKVKDTATLSDNLVKRQHFDSDNIRKKQAAVEEQYRELKALVVRRRQLLVENRELFRFYREADDIETWIVEKEAIASSTDCGVDLEHCLVRYWLTAL
jgi:spectrin beta